LNTTESTYSKGFKGIAIFGGLQVYKIFTSIVTTKISALFLGPIGVGIYGLISSTLATLESLTSCGLGISAIRNFASADKKGDINLVSKIYQILLRLCFISGVIGCLFCTIFSKWLSKLAFGTEEQAWAFALVSITLIFTQLISAQGAILVGLGKLKTISKMRIGVSTLTLFLTVPLYYFFNDRGIVPVILGSSLIYFALSSYYSNKVKLPKISVSQDEISTISKGLFITGIAISLSYTLVALSGYFIRIFIANYGDEVTVGLFISSFALVNTYLGLIFSSIESDFYPRLSGTVSSKVEFERTLSEEMELVLLLVIPLVTFLMVYSQPVLSIFYSSKFFAAKNLIIWSSLSMVAKVPGWACSIAIISIGKNKLYFWNQLIYTLYQLIFNMIGFYCAGLLGIGISYFIGQCLYSVQTIYIVKRHNINFVSKSLSNLIKIIFILTISCAIICTILNPLFKYIFGSIIFVTTSIFCYIQLNQRINITALLKNKLWRK